MEKQGKALITLSDADINMNYHSKFLYSELVMLNWYHQN